jgi:hypothetical protein
MKPYKDSANTNYYMAIDQSPLNGTIAELTFGKKDASGNFVFPNPFNKKTYRYTMRFIHSSGEDLYPNADVEWYKKRGLDNL